MNKMRQEMIDAFLAALQEDRIPWHRTWTAIPVSVPRNAVKDTEYRGVNRFWLLHMAERNGYSDPRWCTYKQAKDNGYQVRKGEKGTHVEFWSLYDRKTKTKISEAEADILRQELSPEEYAERIKPVANTYTVFNAEQIEGIPKLPEEAVKTYELDEGELVQMRETLLENMGVLFQEGGEKAFYRPSEDCIHLPEIRRFESEYDYMATLLHEAGHATGHEGRLHRPTSVEFGTPSYAKEELRAEIASAFTAQALRLSQSGSHMDNHKAYIQSWIKILKNEPDELFRAIRDAEKISDYLIEKGEFNLTRERSEIRKGVEKEREQDSEEKRDVPKVETKETAKDETQKEQPENNFPTPDPNAEPVVTILWSEHSRFHDGETMSLSEANALIESLDRAAVAEDGYYKTKFRIDFVMDGQPNNYIGRQDLGDGDGTLIDHIESYHASYENNVDWDTFVLHNEGKEALEADKVQREMFLHEFVPYLKLHNNLSNMERIATEALQEGGRMTPEETAYHTAMKEYVSKCRAMVNSGDYDLPPVPQRKDFDRELTAYKEHVREEIAQEAAAAGMTVEEYAANGYEPYDAELPDPSVTVSEMTWEQQEEIRLGQENGLDVGVYADPKFTADQMNEIRKGLQNRVDVSLYAAQDLNALQMQEIRNGLEKGENIMKTDQKAAILGYYSGVDGSQYMLYKMGDPEKEYLTNGEKQWDDPADIKPILAQLKQIPHLTDRELIMDQLQQNDPYAPITRHMQEIVGEVSFSTNRTVGEVIQFTDAQEYLKTVEEEIEYQSSSGFGYRTFTDDPETRKGIDDIVYDMYGERNPHDLDYYRDLHDSSDKKKMTIEEIYQSMTPEKQEQFDANRDYGDMEAVKRLIEEQRQELQQGQERKQERSRTHGTI